MCKEYIKQTNRQITFEYLLIKDVNDSLKDAAKLARLLKGMCAKVNLIAFSPVRKFDLKPPSAKTLREFSLQLKKLDIPVTIRHSKGFDIEAACGQLRGRYS